VNHFEWLLAILKTNLSTFKVYNNIKIAINLKCMLILPIQNPLKLIMRNQFIFKH